MKRLGDLLPDGQGEPVEKREPMTAGEFYRRGQEQQIELAKEAGECPHCAGGGVIRQMVPVGDPDFPCKVVPCQACLPQRIARRRQ